MDSDFTINEVEIKRNFKSSVEPKFKLAKRDDSVFLGEENLKNVHSFQK